MSDTAWRAKGLLFENCNCQLVCPGHMSFRQLCTHERCIGAWAVHIEEGWYGEVALDGLDLAIFWYSPQHMIAGGWTEMFFIGEGVFIGLMSWCIAIVLSLPPSAGAGRLVGTLAFYFPLPLVLSPAAIFIWLAIISLGSTAASAYPASRASQLTVRETLAYT